MADRHLFILPSNAYRGADPVAVLDTTEGLKEMGLYNMPYPRDVYVQMHGADCLKSPEGKEPLPHAYVIVGPYGEDQTPRVILHNSDTGWLMDWTDVHDKGATEAKIEQVAQLVESTKMVLITLLATRNVEKIFRENKLAKLGIGKKKFSNRFRYTTTISIPSDLEDDSDHPGIGGSKVPHLRRGHIRRQHYGPNFSYEKKIWIAPVFVNADPDFVNRRAAYNLSMGASL